jgi:glutamate:GABA antiporter
VLVVYGPWEGLVGAVAALALLWIVVANGLTWVMASSRTQAAASLDGIGPAVLGRVSTRTGTPVAATLAGGLVATVTTLAAFAVAGDDNSRSFSVALTCPSRCSPWPICWCSRPCSGCAEPTPAAALWPGLGTANPDAHLPDGFVGQRLAFTVAELVPLGLVLLAAFLLARTRRPPAW